MWHVNVQHNNIHIIAGIFLRVLSIYVHVYCITVTICGFNFHETSTRSIVNISTSGFLGHIFLFDGGSFAKELYHDTLYIQRLF